MLKKALLAVVLVLVAAMIVVNLTAASLPGTPLADGKFVTVDGKQIHYVETPGKGVPVVMIHGLPGTNKDFERVIPRLRGVRTIAIDRPGFGWSKGGWVPYQQQLRLLHGLLGKLGVKRAIFVGHSYGGALTIGMGVKYPHDVARAILVAPAGGGLRVGGFDRVEARYIQFSHWPIVRPIVNLTYGNIALRASATQGADQAFEPAPIAPSYKQRLLAVTMKPGNLKALASERLAYNREVARWLNVNEAQMRVPTVMIAGTGDKLVEPKYTRKLATKLPTVKPIWVSGNHMVMYTHPDVIAEQVLRAERDLGTKVMLVRPGR